jgi:hypothetical protein
MSDNDELQEIRKRAAAITAANNNDELTPWEHDDAFMEFAEYAQYDMPKLLDEIDRLHAILKKLAHADGVSDALFDGVHSEPYCDCAECMAEYQRGWEAGMLDLDDEMEGDK